METNKKPLHGRKPNQKLKAYLVLQYLLKKSDENHAISAPRIVGYLQAEGIDAQVKSVYKDIHEINKAMLMLEQDMYLDEAEEEIKKYGDEVRYIVYDASKKGYYVRERRFDFNEIRLAAESIYSAKFLTENETATLVDLICNNVSEYQADQIKHSVLLTDRAKTRNKNTFNNVSMINSAMSKELDGEKHTPEKISFKYLKTTINDLKQQIERRQGKRYVVSPYTLLLNDGNYYLLAFDDKYQEIRRYRVDRMRDVQLTGLPRDGAKEFADIDLKTYTQRVFSMIGGNQEYVTIRFTNHLLDTVIDRFGTTGAIYAKVDDHHFNARISVEVSNTFFSWLCIFGNEAKIISPSRVVSQFTDYLDKIRKLY